MKPSNETIPGQEIVALRQYLIANGATPAEAGQAISGMAGKSRRDAAKQMSDWSKGLKKNSAKKPS